MMCGIAGWVSFDEEVINRKNIVVAMGKRLRNRGPDSWGTWFSTHCGFAQTRLIVIDPEGGEQPMIKELGERKYVIIYNGELYNTEEIRDELRSLGYKFNGHSDTEVLLNAYIEWGSDCVHKLNGIYAFAVWDDYENELFLSRDRIGVKPLFYTYKNGSLIFGSEIKAILAHPYAQAEVDEEGLAEIFVMGPTRTPGIGIFRDIYELKPGHSLTFNKGGIKIERYWSLVSKNHEDDLKTTMEKIRFLLDDASKRQLVSDVPLCSLLSGGLDSTAVSAFANEKLKRLGSKLITYSVDYIGNDKYFKPNQFQPNSDSDLVEAVSKEIDTDHNYVYVDNEELADALLPALYARDLPGMADVDSSLYLFLREVKKDVKVALSGEGADEVFGGYPWFRNKDAVESGTFPWIRMVEKRMNLLSQDVVKKIRPTEYLNDRYNEALREVPKLSGEDKTSSRMREIFYLNQTRFLSMLLDRMDRMSMASGLEVRVPFLDHRIVEYVWNIPWDMKNLHNREKGLLREALKGYIPDIVVERKKSPYPKTHNPVFKEKVKSWLQRIIDDPSSPILQLINKKEVQNLIDTDAKDYDPAWFSQLMGGPQLYAYLIQVNEWLLKYKIRIL